MKVNNPVRTTIELIQWVSKWYDAMPQQAKDEFDKIIDKSTGQSFTEWLEQEAKKN